MKILTRVFIGGVFSITLLLSYQNCGKGFTTGSDDLQSQASRLQVLPPTISMATRPEQLSNVNSFDFKFNVQAGVGATLKSVSCALDSGSDQVCTSGFSAVGLNDGDHTLKVKAVDNLGNSSEELIFIWKVDATKPILTINQAPNNVVGDTNVSFAFSSNESSNFMCGLDLEAMTSCTTPVLKTVSAGNHTFKIQAIDLAKNMSDLASISFQVDTSVPSLNIATKPKALENSTSASFSFNGLSGATALANFTCKLDNLASVSCNAGTASYTALAEGNHTFTVVGQNIAGKQATSSYTWKIDTVAPSLPVVTPNISSPTKNNSVNFIYSSTDANGISVYECQLDNSAVSTCPATGLNYTSLTDGTHTLKIRATDNAGNTSSFTSYSWLIDTALPTINATLLPASSSSATTASFEFTAVDNGSGIKTIECQLDAGAYTICSSPYSMTNLSVATHKFNLLVTDKASNQKTFSYSWTVTASPNPETSPTPTSTPPPVVIGGEVPVTAASVPVITYRMAKESSDGHNGGVSWESVFLLNNGTIASFGTGNHLDEQSNAMHIIDPISSPGTVKTFEAFPWTQSNSPRDQYTGHNLYVTNYDNHPSIYIPSENKVVWAAHGVFDFNVNQWTYGDRAPLTKPWTDFVADANPSQSTVFNPSVGWCKDLDKGVWFGNSGGGYGRAINDLTLIERSPSGSAKPWKLSVYNMGSQGIVGIDRSRNTSVCIGEHFYLNARVNENTNETVFFKIHIPTMKVVAKLQPVPPAAWGYFPQVVHDAKRNRLVFIGGKILIYSFYNNTWSDVTPQGWGNYEHVNGVYQPTIDAIFFRAMPTITVDILDDGFQWHRMKFND